MPNYNNAEYYIDTISRRVEQLLKERFILRKEIAHSSDGNLAQNSAFLEAFMRTIIINDVNSDKFDRVAFMLRVCS